ncbi:hypothetical protein GCM10022383_16620 [Microbacterium soli]|uniref:DUF11 domain-containing protein n=1 Tax=Microbacterium soli TaxID=446075 RepID=A0ABP7N7L2_9MICO
MRAVAVAGITAFAAALLVAPPAAAAPFSGLEATVFLAQDSPTQLKSSVQGDGELVFSNVGGVANRTYNAIGYNEQDNFLYAVSNAHIIRIHSNGAIEEVRSVPIGAHIGGFRDGTNDFWFTNGNRLFHTNVANPSASVPEVPLKGSFAGPDITWADGYFWSLGGGKISRLSTDGTVTSFTAPARVAAFMAGGSWTYGNGNIGFTDNTTGSIAQISVAAAGSANPSFTVVSVISGPPSGNNDATSSLGAPVDLELAKAFDESRVLVGGDGGFALTVTNHGPGVSSGYTVSDTMPTGLQNLVLPTGCTAAGAELTCSGGRLPAGESQTFRIGATVSPSQQPGTLTNSASVLGNEADPVSDNNDADDTITVDREALKIVKTAELDDQNGNGIPDVGETIDYGFVVTNLGSTTLEDVTVNDPHVVGLTPGTVSALLPGDTADFSAVHELTQADIDSGSIENTATATGTGEFGSVESPPSSVTVDAPAEPALQTVKRAALVDTNGNGAADEGEVIDYTVEVTNTGNVTMSDVSVDDPLITLSPDAIDIAPGETEEFTGSYTVQAADVAAGSVVNTATATGSTPTGDPIDSPPSTTTTETTRTGLSIVKSAEFDDTNGNDELDLGEEITYTFVVTNDGNVTLHDVVVDDPLVAGISPASADIPAGEQQVFTATYVVDSDDVAAGEVENTATVTGETGDGDPLPPVPSNTVTVPTTDPVTDWKLEKFAELNDTNGNGRADVGETIDYSFVATNTGTLPIFDVSISDPMVENITPSAADLVPGQRQTFTADAYEVTQEDVDSGEVHNEATGTAEDVDGDEVTPPPAEVTVPGVEHDPGMRSVKDAVLSDDNGNGVADVGEQISYTITVYNTGNVTLTDVQVSDPLAGALSPASVTELAPGASQVFTAVEAYTVTEDDVESGSVDNTATATGTPPSGPPVTSTSGTSTETVAPGLNVVKSASLNDGNGNGTADPGEVITYTFEVTNTGNTLLEDVVIDDPRVDSVSPASTDIDVNSGAVFTATYVVTEEDILSGDPISNTATATGTVPGGGEITSPPSTADVPPAPVSAGLTVDKSSSLNDANGNGVADLGETIEYTFQVDNTGNVTLSDVAVDDDRVTGLTPASATIPPGGTQVFTADPYTVTQADIDAGEVLNEATASGTAPGGDTVPSDPSTSTVDVVDPEPALVADKTAELDDANGNGVADEGEQIEYTIVLTNTGNVTLHDVSADDDMLTGITPASVASLAPTESATFTADPYTVTAADVDEGVVINLATGSGTTPGGDPITSPPDSVSTPTFDPGMLVEKHAQLEDTNGNGMADLGEQISYTFEVENTGNVAIDDVTVSDPRVTGITPASATLAVGGTLVFTADPYTVTEADILAGSLENTATASGTPDGGTPIQTPPSVVNVPPAPVAPGLDVAKAARIIDANGSGIAETGESIEYSITVTNTGNVTITDVVISDPKLTDITPSSIASLAPGETVTATAAPYVVTAADGARGSVANVASAQGTDPNGDPVGAQSPEVVTPTAGLAGTGSETPVALVGLAVMLLIGAGVLLIGRRRTAAHE